MEPKNTLGITELVDTAVDVLEVGQTVGRALSDGLDLTDIGAVWNVAPRLVEVIRDGKQALAELMDLTPAESAEAVLQISERAHLPATGVLGKVQESLILLARTHQEIADGIDLAQDWIEFVKSIRPTSADESATA